MPWHILPTYQTGLVAGSTVSDITVLGAGTSGKLFDSPLLFVESGGGILGFGNKPSLAIDVKAVSGGTAYAYDGGIIEGGIAADGGLIGAVQSEGTILASGTINVSAVNGGTVLAVNGGTVLAENKGTVINALGDRGTAYSLLGGKIYGLIPFYLPIPIIIPGYAGYLVAKDDGLIDGATVASGASAIAEDHGTIIHATALKQGAVVVKNNGTVWGATADVSGLAYASNGGTIIGGTAAPGGTNGGGVLDAGGGTIIATSGWNVGNATAFNGGTIIAGHGGVASNVSAVSSAAFGITLPILGSISILPGGPGGTIIASEGGTIIGASITGGNAGTGQATALAEGGGAVISHLSIGTYGVATAINNGAIQNATAQNNAVMSALNGGVIDNVSIYNNATAYALSGGTIEGATTYGGTIYAMSDGNLNGTNSAIFGGQIIAQSGAHFDSLCGVSGGTIMVNSGATGSAVIVGNFPFGVASFGGAGAWASMISVGDFGTVYNPYVSSGMTLHVDSGGYVSGAVIGEGFDKGVYDGSTVIITPDAASEAYLASGATMSGAYIHAGESSGTANGGIPDKMGGLLTIQPGAVLEDTSIGLYGQIELLGVDYHAGESALFSNGTLSLLSNGHVLWSTHLKGSYISSGFEVWDDGTDGKAVIVYDPCFLRGTRILTANGEVEIQDLRIGDYIITLKDGVEILRPITAIQSKNKMVSPNLPTDLAGWAVCIKANAFGENLPKRDLRVTSEHNFFFEGRFVPIRMLVNGKSIYYDTSLAAFEYFHLEVDPHSVICAEGVLTESWLNTNEQHEAVYMPDGITRFPLTASRSWEKDAAAPLDVSRFFVEPLWRIFEKRAAMLDFHPKLEQRSFENDPEVFIRIEGGRQIKPFCRKGNIYLFHLPFGVRVASLVSRIFRPSESVGPWLDDRRSLGVLVGKIILARGNNFREVTEHLHAPNAIGWDVIENSPCRWTKGEALLPPLYDEGESDCASLFIEVLAGGPYPVKHKKGNEVDYCGRGTVYA